MDRREFVQSGVGLAAGALVTGAGSRAFGLEASVPAPPDAVFLDRGFAAARQVLKIPPGVPVVPIHADPTALLNHVRELARARAVLRVQGVSREAAPFCLQAALGRQVIDFTIRRLGPDLFHWSATVLGA